MSSALWIPCFNEWTQHVEFPRDIDINMPDERFSGDRHTIYETLQLMRWKINTGLFNKVTITNDGSTDDTLDGIERFRRENNYRKSVFRILNHEANAGKMNRFFEAFDRCREDVFVMTDADMVSSGWDTFNRLFMPNNPHAAMCISPAFEADGRRYTYLEWQWSWTRSLYREKARKIFRKNALLIWDIAPDNNGYGLELALNYFLQDNRAILKWSTPYNVPRFLQCWRKGMSKQSEQMRNIEAWIQAHWERWKKN